MVFKRPYGFLIRHFKLIHLILTGLFIYLLKYVNDILGFYNDFRAGIASKVDAELYLNNGYVLPVVLSIVICVVVYLLLKYKDKPRFLYIVLIGFVLGVSIMINIVQGGLEVILYEVIDTKTLLLYRDLLKILIVFQYISIGMVLVRGLGFDIKKFNFVKDLHELDIDVTDEEEVELTLGNTNVAKRKLHRRLREFKYYYIENKTFILIVVGIILLFSIVGFVINFEFINKVYDQGESFSSEQFGFRLMNSYITRTSYNNEVLLDDEYYFVIADMNLFSRGEKKVFNKANLILYIGDNSYRSENYTGDKFMDLGTIYRKQKVGSDSSYLFVYKVPSSEANKRMRLVYAGDLKVNLKPVMLDKNNKSKNYKVGDKIDLSKTTFGSGSITISNVEIGESFEYPYQYEIGGKIYDSKYTINSSQGSILKLDISSKYPFGLDDYTFLDTYGTLKYKVDDKEYKVKSFINKTPVSHQEGIYVSVDKNIVDATDIWFDIQIRSERYIYKIK